MEGTITRQLGMGNFEVEAGGGLVRRHADQLLKFLLCLAEEGITDVQADNIANNPGTPVIPEIPEETMEPENIQMNDTAAAPLVSRRPTTPPICTLGCIRRRPIKLNDYVCSPK